MSTFAERPISKIRPPDARESTFVSAARVHEALTAGLEKRILLWMAHRTPHFIHSDHLTALALVSQLLAGAAYAVAFQNARALWLVDSFLALNWLGDSLDGTLARVRNRQRPRYGFYVDHIADTFGSLALMAGLACSGYLHWQIAAGMLVWFYALSIESYLAAYTLGRFHLSHGVFGPTEIRILLAAGNILLFAHASVHIAERNFPLSDVAGVVAILAMALTFSVAAIRHTVLLYREEALS